MAESLTDYLKELGVKVNYLHSDVDTLERIEIIRDLRLGEFDVLVGINLLREGLDLPEVELVAIMDADKEGFLRSETSLIQTIGRAARNVDGKVIMYADTVTDSMRKRDRRDQPPQSHSDGVQRGAPHHPQDRAQGGGRPAGGLPRAGRGKRQCDGRRGKAAGDASIWRSRCSKPPDGSISRPPPSSATSCSPCAAKRLPTIPPQAGVPPANGAENNVRRRAPHCRNSTKGAVPAWGAGGARGGRSPPRAPPAGTSRSGFARTGSPGLTAVRQCGIETGTEAPHRGGEDQKQA